MCRVRAGISQVKEPVNEMSRDRLNRIVRITAVCLLAGMGAGLFWLRVIDGGRPEREPLMLQFESSAPAQVEGLVMVDGHRPVPFRTPPSRRFSVVGIPLPEGVEPVTSIRFDPLRHPGEVHVRALRIMRAGKELARIGPEHIESLNPNAQIQLTNDVWRIRYTGDADYPVLLFRDIYPLPTPVFDSRTFGKGALLFLSTVCAVLGVLLIVTFARATWRCGRDGVALVGGVFLAILGLRLMTLQYFGDRVPHWDYWSLPWTVYLPFQSGHLTWQSMIAPVNEHRIFFTRLWSLTIFLLNGQWENLLEATANSMLHSLTGAALALVLWKAMNRKQAWLIFPSVVAVFGLPFSWENTVWANQSQFYFFLGFSLLTFWLLGMHRPFSTRWWLGCAAALAASFTVGSGIMAPVIVLALMGYQAVRDPAHLRQYALTAAMAAGLTVVAWMFRVPGTGGSMRTETVSQFVQTFGRTLSWPFTESVWLWIVLWLPWAIFVMRCLFRRPAWSSAEAWIVTLGGWGLANALGVGLFRGAFSQGPLSRYMDITALPMLSSALALVLIGPWCVSESRWRAVYQWGRIGWFALVLAGVLHLTNHEINHRATHRLQQQTRAQHNLRAFMVSDDMHELLARTAYEVPHPNKLALATWLRAPAMRDILPASIRDPLPLRPARMRGFTTPGLYFEFAFDLREPSWGSYGREGDRTTGEFVSEALPAPRHRYLQFPVRGRISGGQDTVRLEVVDITGRRYRVQSRGDTTDDWETAYVRVPRKPLTVQAVDNDLRFWIAFRAPREVATGSFATFRFMAMGPLVFSAGLLLLLWPVRRWVDPKCLPD